MEVIIITGLSGAGKSQAVNCMEDLGYYCIDNMPPRLIREFISLVESGTSGIDKAAFVVDIRQGSFFEDLKEALENLKKSGTDYRILFLEGGNILEQGTPDELFGAPKNARTRDFLGKVRDK